MPDEPPSEIIPLQTRKFSCFFQTSTGFLRRVKTSGVEVIRAIYGTVRDKNWDTVEPRLEIERIEQGPDSFLLQFTAHHEERPDLLRMERHDRRTRRRIGVYFRWTAPRNPSSGIESAFACSIQSLSALESLAVSAIQTAPGKSNRFRGSFRRINLLKTFGRSRGHPQIEFRRTSSWKARSLKWRTSEIGPTLPSRRTALHLNFPFPCSLAPANRSASASFSAWSSNTEQFLHPKKRLPRSSSPLVQRRNQSQRSACPPPRVTVPHSSFDRERLARLRLNHLRVDLRFSDSNWKTLLQRAQEDAAAIGSRLQCALFLTNSAEQNLLDFREAIKPEIVDICLIFHQGEKSTSSQWFDLAERHLGQNGFRLATGTNAYFAELNRQRPPRRAHACYSINPQVHTFDDLSLLETLEAQPSTVESAAQFCDGEADPLADHAPSSLQSKRDRSHQTARVTFHGNRRSAAANPILRRMDGRKPRAAHVA